MINDHVYIHYSVYMHLILICNLVPNKSIIKCIAEFMRPFRVVNDHWSFTTLKGLMNWIVNVNQTEIRLYLPFSVWFVTKGTLSVWFQINMCMANTIGFGCTLHLHLIENVNTIIYNSERSHEFGNKFSNFRRQCIIRGHLSRLESGTGKLASLGKMGW